LIPVDEWRLKEECLEILQKFFAGKRQGKEKETEEKKMRVFV
jgi:hypothetical protein